MRKQRPLQNIILKWLIKYHFVKIRSGCIHEFTDGNKKNKDQSLLFWAGVVFVVLILMKVPRFESGCRLLQNGLRPDKNIQRFIYGERTYERKQVSAENTGKRCEIPCCRKLALPRQSAAPLYFSGVGLSFWCMAEKKLNPQPFSLIFFRRWIWVSLFITCRSTWRPFVVLPIKANLLLCLSCHWWTVSEISHRRKHSDAV